MALATATKKKTVAGTNDGKPVSVPLHKINRLPQMRGLFDEAKIKDLAVNIDKEGILQDPGAVLLHDGEGSHKFLEDFNRVKNTDIKLSDLSATVVRGKRTRCLLIFGECRTRALLMIWEKGKPTPDGFIKQRSPGSYFRQRFGSDLVRLNCFKNGDAFAAISRQLAENTYNPPSPAERATAETELFLFKKALAELQERKYSVAEYARERKQSPSVIRSLINWTTQLPRDVQEAVINGIIQYGVSQQLLRAHKWGAETMEDEAERKQFFDRLVLDACGPDVSTNSFQKEVTKRIAVWEKDKAARDDGQFDLTSLMEESAIKANYRAGKKRELSRSTEMSLRSMCASVSSWKTFLESGRLAPTHSPLLAGSVRRQVVRLTVMLNDFLESGEWLASPEVLAEMNRLAQAVPECMEKLDELYPHGEILQAAND